MNTLQNEIINTRKIYRELFNNARSAIERQIDSLKKASLCNHCKQGCDIDFNKITVLQKFPGGCRYKFWQESVLNLLENQISKDIYERIQIIENEDRHIPVRVVLHAANLQARNILLKS